MKNEHSQQPGESAGPQDRRGLALLFPGQGSQHTGMGQRIAEISQAARDIFAQADEALSFRISRLCFEGSEEELEDTVNTQPAILTTSLAHLAYLRERLQETGRRLTPSFMAGHSLGQFAAAVGADSLDFSDGVRLVQERGRIMAEWAHTRPGGLASILGMSEAAVRDVCDEASPKGEVAVAVVNSPGQTVISGASSALDRAVAVARGRGARVIRLPISVPSHTPMMDEAASELSRFIAKVSFRAPTTPLVSNISARLLTTAEEVRQELSDQICAAVQWARCVAAMANGGADSFVEVGPGQALSNIVRRLRGDVQVFNAERDAPERLFSLTDTVPLSAPEHLAGGKRIANPASGVEIGS